MTIRILDNQKIDMTDDEYTMFQKIVQSYTVGLNKGEDLFSGLFRCNDQGIILYLIPPSKKHTSLEVFLFLQSLMMQQHLRLMHAEVSDVCCQLMEKIKEMDEKSK